MNWFTFSVYLALVLGGFVAGYKVSSWIETSKEVERLKAELDTANADRDAEQAARKAADDARAVSDAALLDMQEKERENDKQRHALVPRVVADNRSCDLGAGAIGLLNNALRGDAMPGAASGGEEGGRSGAGDNWLVTPATPAP